MNSLFSYDSKPMQLMMRVGDLIILNLLFILCCIPIFTIGAAQAGLHTGIKVLLDKEDETQPSAAFFKGFANGFGTITLGWGLITVLLLVVVWMGVSAIALGAPKWLIIFIIAMCAIFHSLIPAFHARFGCTIFQLYKNCWLLMFAHPLRSIATGVLVWLPVIILYAMDLYSVLAMAPIWIGFFYSTAFAFVHGFLSKPFKSITDQYNEINGITPDDKTEDASDSEADEDEDAADAEEEEPVCVE